MMIASIFLHVVISHFVATRMHENARPPTGKSGHYLDVAKKRLRLSEVNHK